MKVARIADEIRAVAFATLYFGVWIGTLMLVKVLILAEYQIPFHHFSLALVGALVLAKVVLVLELVPLGAWLSVRPAWWDVVARTLLYGLGVLIVLLFEKAFEARHEYGSLAASLAAVFRHTEIHHVWANTIVLAGALLGFNALGVVRRQLGKGGLWQLFRSPLRE